MSSPDKSNPAANGRRVFFSGPGLRFEGLSGRAHQNTPGPRDNGDSLIRTPVFVKRIRFVRNHVLRINDLRRQDQLRSWVLGFSQRINGPDRPACFGTDNVNRTTGVTRMESHRTPRARTCTPARFERDFLNEAILIRSQKPRGPRSKPISTTQVVNSQHARSGEMAPSGKTGGSYEGSNLDGFE